MSGYLNCETYDGTKLIVQIDDAETIEKAEGAKQLELDIENAAIKNEQNIVKRKGFQFSWEYTDPPPIPCTHPNKYKNIISANLKFWACPDCGDDLGDCE